MTLQELQQEIDRRFELQKLYIQSVQSGYFESRSRYFQGLSTHSAIPADGQELAPDLGLEKPIDQAETWLDVGQLPAQMLSQMEINVYHSQQGHGYFVVLRFQYGNDIWEKSINFGPEESFGHDWRIA